MQKRMSVFLGVLCGLLTVGLVGCSAEKSTEEEVVLEELRTEPGDIFRQELQWGDFADHPMQASIADCVFLDEELFVILHRVLYGRDLGSDDIRALSRAFGMPQGDWDDDFKRQRQIEEVQDRALERIDEILGHHFCVDFELYLDGYDFGGGVFQNRREWCAEGLSRSGRCEQNLSGQSVFPGGLFAASGLAVTRP